MNFKEYIEITEEIFDMIIDDYYGNNGCVSSWSWNYDEDDDNIVLIVEERWAYGGHNTDYIEIPFDIINEMIEALIKPDTTECPTCKGDVGWADTGIKDNDGHPIIGTCPDCKSQDVK